MRRQSSSEPLAELRLLYDEIDALHRDRSCPASTDCCRFGVTGREPYPTAIELSELERAVRARGGIPKRRVLPIASERRCPLLGDDGKCVVYASRPFGCRTFYCRLASGPRPIPRFTSVIRELEDRSGHGARGRPLRSWVRSKARSGR